MSKQKPRRETRPRTVNVKLPLFRPEEHVDYPKGIERPKTRGDCHLDEKLGGWHMRPCPFVSCSQHLGIDVSRNGSLKLNWPADTLDGVAANILKMRETCALDVADREELTLDQIGDLLNVTRERIRQLVEKLLAKLKRSQSTARSLGEKYLVEGQMVESDDYDPSFEPDDEDYLASIFSGSLKSANPEAEPREGLWED